MSTLWTAAFEPNPFSQSLDRAVDKVGQTVGLLRETHGH
jgi:hypothetical protein